MSGAVAPLSRQVHPLWMDWCAAAAAGWGGAITTSQYGWAGMAKFGPTYTAMPLTQPVTHPSLSYASYSL